MKNKLITIVIALFMALPLATAETWVGGEFTKKFTAKPEQGGWVADPVGDNLVFGTTSIGQNYPRGTAVSDNGKYAAANFNNGRPGLQTITHDGPTDIIGGSNAMDRPLTLSDNGEYLTAGSLDTGLYSYEQGTVDDEWNATHSTVPNEIASTSDGEYIIAGTDGGMIHVYARHLAYELWNVSAGGKVVEVDVSAGGEVFAFAASDMVKLYNVYGNLLHQENLGSDAKSVAVSDDGNYVVYSDSSQQVFMINGTDSWNAVTNFPFNLGGTVTEVAVNCDGTRVIASSTTSVRAIVGFTNPNSGSAAWEKNPVGTSTTVNEIDMSCDGRYASVATTGGVGTGELWLVDFEDASSNVVWRFEDDEDCNSASISDDGLFVVATCTDAHYIFTAGWDGWSGVLTDGVPIWSLDTVVDSVFDYSEISKDGRYFAYTKNIGVGTASEVVQSTIPRPPTTYTNGNYEYKYLDMSEDGKYIITHGSKGSMTIYSNLLVFDATQNPRTMSPIINLEYLSDGIGSVAISPNGTIAAYHYVDRDTGYDLIKILSIPSGTLLGEYNTGAGPCAGIEESDMYVSDEQPNPVRVTVALCDILYFLDEAGGLIHSVNVSPSVWRGLDGSKDGTTVIACESTDVYVFDTSDITNPVTHSTGVAGISDCEMDDNSVYAGFTDDGGNIGTMTLSSGATSVDNVLPSIGMITDISEDGAFIASFDLPQNKVFLYDTTSMGTPIFEHDIGVAVGAYNSVDWTEDGSRFIVATEAGVLLFEWGSDETWDSTDATPVWAWDSCEPVASASEERIAWADSCGRVHWKENTEFPNQGSLILLWDLENGRTPLWAKVPPKVQSNNTYWAYDLVVGNDGTVYVESRYDLDNGTTPFILYAWDKAGEEKWNVSQENQWWFSKHYYPTDSRSGLDVAANHSLVIALDDGFAYIDKEGVATLLATPTCDNNVMGGQSQFAGNMVAISCYPSDTSPEYHMFDLMCSPHPCGGDWSYDSDARAYDVQVSENDKYVVFANGTQVIFRSTSNDVLFQKAIQNVRSVAISNNGKVALASSTDGWKLYDASGQLLKEEAPPFIIYGIDMDKQGDWLAISGWNSTTGSAHMQVISLRQLDGYYAKYEVAVDASHTPPSGYTGRYHSYEVHIAEGSTKVIWSYSGAYSGEDDDNSAGLEYWYAPDFNTFVDFIAFRLSQVVTVFIVFTLVFGLIGAVTKVYAVRSEGR